MITRKREISENEKKFREECRFLNISHEYPGSRSDVRYVIFTEFNEEELNEKYGDVICGLVPYIILPLKFMEPIVKYYSNERKFLYRSKNTDCHFEYTDTVTEIYHPELITNADNDSYDWTRLNNAISKLTETQRVRLKMKYFEGYKNVEIAAIQGVTSQAVDVSIKRAIKNLKNFFKTV